MWASYSRERPGTSTDKENSDPGDVHDVGSAGSFGVWAGIVSREAEAWTHGQGSSKEL